MTIPSPKPRGFLGEVVCSPPFPLILGVGSFVLALAGQALLRPSRDPWWGVVLLVVAGASFGLTTRFPSPREEGPSVPQEQKRPAQERLPRHGGRWLLGAFFTGLGLAAMLGVLRPGGLAALYGVGVVLLMSLGGGLLASSAGMRPAPRALRWAAAGVGVLFLAALWRFLTAGEAHLHDALLLDGALTALLLWWWQTRGSALPRVRVVLPASARFWEGALLAAVLLVAAGVRFYRLESLPWGVYFDEAQNGLEAQRILKDPSFRPVFMTTFYKMPAFYFYELALSMQVLGETPVAVRTVSALTGLLSVGAFYFLSRQLWGPWLALAVSLALALSRWHLTFSRLGFNSVATVLFASLTLAFLWQGLRTGRKWPFLWAGLSLGLGFHTYYAFLLVPVFLALFVLHQTVLNQKARSVAFLRGIGLMVVVALLVSAPLIPFVVQQPGTFGQRFSEVSLFKGKSPEQGLVALGETIKKHLLMLHGKGDANGRHNLPGEPMLDVVSGGLLMLGLGYSVFRWREAGSFLALTWLGIMLLPGILSLNFEAPQANRSIGVIPALYLLMGLALHQGWRLWRRAAGTQGPGIFGISVGALVFLAGGLNLHTYFVRQAGDFAAWAAHNPAETTIARFLAGADPTADLYLSPVYHGHPTIAFLAPTSRGAKQFALPGDLVLQRSPDREVRLALEPVYAYLQPYFPKIYPGGAFALQQDPFRHVLYLSGIIPRSENAKARQLQLTYRSLTGREPERVVQRAEPIALYGSGDTPMAPPFEVEGRSTLLVPRSGVYELALAGPAEATLLVDGSVVLTKGAGDTPSSVKLPLAAGLHPLVVRARILGPADALSLRWKPPGGQEGILPSDALFSPHVPSWGLLGRYFANDAWEGEPAFLRIDPAISFYFHVTPLPRPYSIEWVGRLSVPQGGTYRFGTESIDGSWLLIDGKAVVVNPQGDGQYREGSIALDEGGHHLQLRYVNRRHFPKVVLYWTPPGRQREVLPAVYLSPGTAVSSGGN